MEAGNWGKQRFRYWSLKRITNHRRGMNSIHARISRPATIPVRTAPVNLLSARIWVSKLMGGQATLIRAFLVPKGLGMC